MFWLLIPIMGIIIICTYLGWCIGSDEKVDWKGFTFFIICFLLSLVFLFGGIHELQQEAIRDFETGKYRKEITYKIRQIEDHPIIYDSTVVYKLK